MSTAMERLIELISQQRCDSVDWTIHLRQQFPEWEKELRKAVDSDLRWLDEVGESKKPESLCWTLVNAGNLGLVTRWMRSTGRYQREAAELWLLAHFQVDEIWENLPAQERQWVIAEIFDRFPGEPLRTQRDLRSRFNDSGAFAPPSFAIALCGHVPSGKIEHLRGVAKRTGDA